MASRVGLIEKIHAIPHFHTDLEWWKTEGDYAKDCLAIGRAAVELLDAEPAFTYVLDQAYSVIPLLKADPAAFERLKAHARRGRVEPVGATMTAPDHNLPTGEALVRNLLLGKRWWTENLGRTPRVGWGIDTFGHPPQLPQILAKCGLVGYVFSRGPNALSGDEPSAFLWEAPDGTRLAAFWFVATYTGFWPVFPLLRWNLRYHFRELRARLAYEGRRNATPVTMVPMGSDFMKPSATWAPFIRLWNAQGNAPPVEFSTPSAFFDDLASRRETLPIRRTEMNPVLAGGYESRHKIKQAARRLERRALDWERLAAAAPTAAGAYPARAIRETWHQLVKNDFHDTINGTPIDPAMREAFARAEAAKRSIAGGIEAAVSALASELDTRGGGACVLAFNPLSWAREELLTIGPERSAGKVPVAEDGSAVESQAVGDGLLVRMHLPGLGARRISLVSGDANASRPRACAAGAAMEDGVLRVDFDAGGLRAIRDLRSGRDIVARPSGLRIAQDFGNLWTVAETGEEEAGEMVEAPTMLESGPLRSVVRLRASFPCGDATSTYSLLHGRGFVDVETRLRFTGRDRRVLARLKLAFDGELVCETPYHATPRPAGHWPCQGWAGVFGKDTGLAVFNRGIPSILFDGRDLSLGLMRSVSVRPKGFGKFVWKNLRPMLRAARRGISLTWQGVNLIEMALGQYHWIILREYASEGVPYTPGLPGPLDLLRVWMGSARPSDAWDRGEHVFEYRLMPTSGAPKFDELTRIARQFESPPILRDEPGHEGRLRAPARFMRIDGDAICEVVKKAEDSDDLVLRAYDASGAGARLIVEPGFKITRALRVALTEDAVLREEAAPGGRLDAALAPWEIATFILKR